MRKYRWSKVRSRLRDKSGLSTEWKYFIFFSVEDLAECLYSQILVCNRGLVTVVIGTRDYEMSPGEETRMEYSSS